MDENNKLYTIDDCEDGTYCIPLPKKIEDLLEVDESCHVELTTKENSVIVRFTNNSKDNKNIGLLSFFIPALLATLAFMIFFLYQQQDQIYLTGGLSLATFVLTAGMVSSILCFTISFIKGKKGEIVAGNKYMRWRSFPTILISFGIILFLLALVFFQLMELLFAKASFDLWTSSFIFLILVCVMNYIMIFAVMNISTRLMMTILVFMIIGGVFTAMATNSEHLWWQHNFSFLGSSEATRNWEFNLTLVFSALLMIALVDFLFIHLYRQVKVSKQLIILESLLILTAISLGLVGLFPFEHSNEFYQWLHNHSAANLVYLIIILIVSIRWLLPGISKDFLNLSYIIGGSLILCTILFYIVGYLSLTAFELLSFVFSFSWLFLLFNEIERIIEQTRNFFEVVIQPKKKS